MYRSDGYLSVLQTRDYPLDRTAGSALMILSAILIPLNVIFSVASTVFLGGVAVVGRMFPHEHIHATGGVSLFHLMYGIALLAGLVYAGYGISRSQKQGFLVAIAIGVAALLTHSVFFLALPAIIYSALRICGGAGPKPA